MILLMTLIYLGCVLAAFKIIKLKVTPVSVGVSALIGVLLLGGIVTLWKLASPMSGQLTLRRPVARINPDLREFVSKVHVESNQLVSKGEPLFEISRTRFAYAVDAATASLASARSKVSQLEASVTAAEATIQKAEADTGVAKAEIDTARRLKRSSAGAVSKLKIAEAQAAYQCRASEHPNNASLPATDESRTRRGHVCGGGSPGCAGHGAVQPFSNYIPVAGRRPRHQLSGSRGDTRDKVAGLLCGHDHGPV
jgi:multidrug resistance efflux pump